MSFEKKKSSKSDRMDAIMKSLKDDSISLPLSSKMSDELKALSRKAIDPFTKFPELPTFPPLETPKITIPRLLPGEAEEGSIISRLRDAFLESAHRDVYTDHVSESIFYGLKVGDICGVMLTQFHSIVLFQYKAPLRNRDRMNVEFIENSDRVFPDPSAFKISTKNYMNIKHEDVFIREKVLMKLFPTFYEDYKKDMI